MYNNSYVPYMPYTGYPSAAQENMYGNEEMMPEYMPQMMPQMPTAPQYMAPMPQMPQYMPMGQMKPFYMEKERKCVKVPEVIGRNHCQILLETDIPFPQCYPAMEIKDIMKEVTDLILSVCNDKVLINGKLHKNINYKTFESVGKHKCQCEELRVVYGDVRHVSVHLPFSGYIEIPGAKPGDTVEVEYAGVEDSCELDMLKDPCFIKGCDIPVYKKLKEKVIVKIDIKVLRPIQITLDPISPNICP